MKLKKHPVLKAALCLAVSVLPYQIFAQGFQKTLQDGNFTNHNSIVNSIDNNGDVIIAGTILKDGDPDQTDIQIQKIDNKGNVVWRKTYDITAHDFCYHVNNVKDGYILTGSVRGNDRQSVYLLKVDRDGNFVQDNRYDNINSDTFLPINSQGMSVIEDIDGEIVIAGFGIQGGYGDHAFFSKKGFVLKLDRDLNFKTGRSFDNIMPEHILETPKRELIITGGNTNGVGAAYIAQLDNSLNVNWQTSFSIGYLLQGLPNTWRTVGAHTVYDEDMDHLFVLGNDDNGSHQYSITELNNSNGNIVNVLGSLGSTVAPPGAPTTQASNFFGFMLLPSPTNNNHLIVVGHTNSPNDRIRQGTVSIDDNNFLIAAEIHKTDGKVIWHRTYKTTVPNYVTSDFSLTNGLFAATSGDKARLIYTPAIASITPSRELMMLTYMSQDYNSTDNYDLTLVKEAWRTGNCDIKHDVFNIIETPTLAETISSNQDITRLSTYSFSPVPRDTNLNPLDCEEYECNGVANFTYNLNSCHLTVQGQYTGNGYPINWHWNIHGSIFSGQNPTIPWNYVGNMTSSITLTVTSVLPNGITCTSTKNVQFYVPCGGIDKVVPKGVAESSIYPVPFSDKTNISFKLDQATETEVKAYDIITGREISVIFKGELTSGKHEIQWIPTKSVPAGVYLIQIKTGNETANHRVILQK